RPRRYTGTTGGEAELSTASDGVVLVRIVCVGGGPAVRYAASLLKRRDPRREVIVLERGRPDQTFGFGVVFSDPTLDQLANRDQVTYRRLLENSVRWSPIEIRIAGEVVRPDGQGFSAI